MCKLGNEDLEHPIYGQNPACSKFFDLFLISVQAQGHLAVRRCDSVIRHCARTDIVNAFGAKGTREIDGVCVEFDSHEVHDSLRG